MSYHHLQVAGILTLILRSEILRQVEERDFVKEVLLLEVVSATRKRIQIMLRVNIDN